MRLRIVSGDLTAMVSLTLGGTLAAGPWHLGAAIGATVVGLFWLARALPEFLQQRGFLAALFRYEPVPPFWLWGRVLWHAVVRVVAFAATAFASIGPLLLVDYTAPARIKESFVFGFILVTVVLGNLIGSSLIVLTNRPRVLVPRRFRDKPGLVPETWDVIRQRHRAKQANQ